MMLHRFTFFTVIIYQTFSPENHQEYFFVYCFIIDQDTNIVCLHRSLKLDIACFLFTTHQQKRFFDLKLYKLVYYILY